MEGRIDMRQPDPLLPPLADYGLRLSNGQLGAVRAFQIEPIQPSGAAPSEYSLAELMDKCREGQGVAA
jgi:hypothetical protein